MNQKKLVQAALTAVGTVYISLDNMQRNIREFGELNGHAQQFVHAAVLDMRDDLDTLTAVLAAMYDEVNNASERTQ